MVGIKLVLRSSMQGCDPPTTRFNIQSNSSSFRPSHLTIPFQNQYDLMSISVLPEFDLAYIHSATRNYCVLSGIALAPVGEYLVEGIHVGKHELYTRRSPQIESYHS